MWLGHVRAMLLQLRVDLRKRKIARFASTPIAESRPGIVVKIVGRAEAAGELVEAPLTAASAVASVTCLGIIGRRSDPPTAYVRDEQINDFIVRDPSGAALIRVRRACVVTIPSVVPTPDVDRKSRWMRRWRARDRFLGLERKLQFSEAALAVGAEVKVLGTCVERHGGDGPYREQSDATITIDAAEGGVVIVDW
ncbi:MAG TPA: hypothetical protein VGH63_09355 [Polyangia bacterium]